MANEGISEELRRFIAENIDSVELLEVLLLLRSNTKKEWSAENVSREIRSNPTSVYIRLSHLCARGLLSLRELPTPLYRYSPRTEELDQTVAGLAKAYAERQTRVIELIYSKQTDALRNFSDAFKLKKDDWNG